MNDLAEKQPKNLSEVTKSKQELLLTRIQSFTCKETSEACRGMDEKLLERTAQMCEKLAALKIDPTPAVSTIANLSKHPESKHEILNIIIDRLETTDYWFLKHAERLSANVSSQKFLEFFPLLERINSWNMRVFDQSLKISEEKVVNVSSELLRALPDEWVAPSVQLGKLCAEREIKPEHLFEALTFIANKKPTSEQFSKIHEEFSKLIPVLRTEVDIIPPLFIDHPSDTKKMYIRKPEWTLDAIAKKAAALNIDEFTDYLKRIRVKEDLFLSMMEGKEEEPLMEMFKKEIKQAMSYHAGAVAFAIVLSENQNTYSLIKEAFSKRKEKGYYSDMFDYTQILDPLETLNSILTHKGKEPLPYNPPDVELPQLMKGEVTYTDLKEVENLFPVQSRIAALHILLNEYKEEFARRISVLTPANDIRADEISGFIKSFLEVTKEKHLYEKQFSFADIGTGSGEFTSEFVGYIKNNFENPKIIRTNPTEIELKHHKELGFRLYDATEKPLGENLNLLIIKDVMKFFDEKGREKIWENVKRDVVEGGVVISGSTTYVPYEGAYKMHVKYKGELVKVDPTKFLQELMEIKNHQEYITKLDGIVENCKVGD
ncbi:MAG: hypothetical protein QXF56_02410 [Candidatus Micrarchaeia archaeon]